MSLDDADRLHGCAEIGIGLGHELARVLTEIQERLAAQPLDAGELQYILPHVQLPVRLLVRGFLAVIFAVDEQSGKLTLVGHESVRGKTPRNFAIDPTGNFLLVANQDTNNVVTFRIDPATGKLNATGEMTDVPKPVCLKIVRF